MTALEPLSSLHWWMWIRGIVWNSYFNWVFIQFQTYTIPTEYDRNQKGSFGSKFVLFFASKSTWITQKEVDLHDIYVIYPSGCLVVFLTFLEHLWAQMGFSPSGGHFLSSSSDPTWVHSGRVKCIIDHMRAILYFVHFCPKFMVLGQKRV